MNKRNKTLYRWARENALRWAQQVPIAELVHISETFYGKDLAEPHETSGFTVNTSHPRNAVCDLP